MEAGTRIAFDPTIIPVLTSNIEQEGILRYDRGEQLLEKIQDSGAFVACILQRTSKSLELLK